jgi:hypothetical protein
MTPSEFATAEARSYDNLGVKKSYIDIAGEDLVSGILLSQIVYWNLPAKDGRTKLGVNRDGKLWLAKKRADWWEECRITEKQFLRSCQTLKFLGFIEVKLFKFDGSPTTHIWLNWPAIIQALDKLPDFKSDSAQRDESIRPKGINGNSPKGRIQPAQRDESLTESTAKSTSDSFSRDAAGDPPTPKPNGKEKPPPNPDHSILIEQWHDAYRMQFGFDYKMTRGIDGKGAQQLLAGGRTVEEIMKVATAAWGRPNGFSCKWASTIRGLDTHWNEIKVELNGSLKPGQVTPNLEKSKANMSKILATLEALNPKVGT